VGLDAEWELIGSLPQSKWGRWARPAGDNRRFLNGILYVLRLGCPWWTCKSAGNTWTCKASPAMG
jgi:transposase